MLFPFRYSEDRSTCLNGIQLPLPGEKHIKICLMSQKKPVKILFENVKIVTPKSRQDTSQATVDFGKGESANATHAIIAVDHKDRLRCWFMGVVNIDNSFTRTTY